MLTLQYESKVIQGKKDQITSTYPLTGNKKIGGPCLLHLLFGQVDPSLVVSMESLCEQIKTAKLHGFKKNVDELLTFAPIKYSK